MTRIRRAGVAVWSMVPAAGGEGLDGAEAAGGAEAEDPTGRGAAGGAGTSEGRPAVGLAGGTVPARAGLLLPRGCCDAGGRSPRRR